MGGAGYDRGRCDTGGRAGCCDTGGAGYDRGDRGRHTRGAYETDRHTRGAYETGRRTRGSAGVGGEGEALCAAS